MNLAREWTAFAGGLFLLMGISLAASARRGAEDVLSWQRQWRAAAGVPEPVRDEALRLRRLALAYRLGGLGFAVLGLGLLLCAASGRALFTSRGGSRENMLGGVLFTACGAVLAVNAGLRRGRRAPRFSDGELLGFGAPLAPGERVAAACTRGIIALFLAFGVLLLRAGLR